MGARIQDLEAIIRDLTLVAAPANWTNALNTNRTEVPFDQMLTYSPSLASTHCPHFCLN